MDFKNVIAKRTGKVIAVDGNVVHKVFGAEYPKANVLNEALNHARVEETEINVPKIHSVSEIDGSLVISMDYAVGKPLAEFMATEEGFDQYIGSFVDLQLQIHEQDCPLLSSHREKMTRKISETDLSATLKYDLHTRLESMPKHKKLLHGDFNPSNVILSDDGIMTVLDWSHATKGNASADVARTYLLFCLERGVEKADKYLNLFCEKTGTAKKYVQGWLPIVAASQLVKGKQEERDFLVRWADVVDYE